ncbi:hypothetical protein M405DRAFT_835660, partial [Rhizopogon salebrosus TDB-379]
MAHLCGPSPGYLSRAPCGPRFGSRPSPGLLALLPSTLTSQSALVLLFSFLFTPSF